MKIYKALFIILIFITIVFGSSELNNENVYKAFESNLSSINGHFDAFDVFRNTNDKRISTKIVNKNFIITIATIAIDKESESLTKFNGTVCSRIITNTGVSATPWQKTLFNNVQSQLSLFTKLLGMQKLKLFGEKM